MRRTTPIRTSLLFAATVFASLPCSAGILAGSFLYPVPQSSSSKDTAKPKPNSTTDNATQNAPDQPTWDPLRAERDLEVGQYYMHKGDLDAAIDRFEDAAVAKPGYAVPYRFLGECQEKKGLKRDAIKSYTRYLDLFPHAEDKEKIEKKIEKLRSEVEKSKKKSAG
jgi:tetratricopeptide (TPR) repeat protein